MSLDEYLKFDAWKTVDEDPYYDWKLVRKVSALALPSADLLLTLGARFYARCVT